MAFNNAGITGGAHRFEDYPSADFDNVLRVNVSYTLNGVSYTQFASGLSSTDPSSVAWNVPVADTAVARVLVCARDRTDLLGCDASNADFTIDSSTRIEVEVRYSKYKSA